MSSVLLFTENYARGGSNRYFTDLAGFLRQDFDRVTVFSNREAFFPEDRAALAGMDRTVGVPLVTKAMGAFAGRHLPGAAREVLRLLLMPCEIPFQIWQVTALRHLVRAHRPDLVINVNGGYPGGEACCALAVACGLEGVPNMMMVLSMPKPRRPHAWFHDALVDTLVGRGADLLAGNAAALTHALVERRGFRVDRTAVLPNGVPDRPSPARIMNRSEVTIGFLSRVEEAKGIFVLVQAFARVAARHDRVRLRVVGHGDGSSELVRRIATLPCRERIEVTGFYEGDLHELLQSFDVFCFPSFYEGLPYSLLEAMRAGCPIVATAVGGIPEALQAGRDALLVPPASVDALERALEQLIVEPELRIRLATAVRRRYEAEFTHSAMAGRLRSLIARILPDRAEFQDRL